MKLMKTNGVARFIMTWKYIPHLNYLSLQCHKIIFKPIKINSRARCIWKPVDMKPLKYIFSVIIRNVMVIEENM